MKVPVGPSTWALIIAALGAVIAFITEWSQSGSAPTWLAGIAAGLTALLGILRSWQANNLAGNAYDMALASEATSDFDTEQ